MGRWMNKLNELPKQAVQSVIPRRREYAPVDAISLTEGWRQIESGTWAGVGLLKVLPGYTHLFGVNIIIAEEGRNRAELQQQFPDMTIFSPDEFKQIINEWPESEAIVCTMRQFKGRLVS